MTTPTTLSLDRRGEFDFAKPQFRALIRDGRLSFAARGFFQFLWDLPAGWDPRPAHLVKMSGAGREALMRLRRELEAVGGLKVEAVRLTSEEAAERNAKDPDRRQPYRAGQVVGSRWVLFSPHLWAREMPLDADVDEWRDRETGFPSLGLSGSRSCRQPENQPLRFTDVEGSPRRKQQHESTTSAAARRRGDEKIIAGIESWTPSDVDGIKALVAEHGAEHVAEVASGLTPAAGHRAPYLSAVVSAFQTLASAEAAATAEAARQARLAAPLVADQEALARGNQMLANIRDRHRRRETEEETS